MSTAITNITRTTEYDSAKRIKWETELLEKAEGKLIIDKFATNKVMGKGEAGTYRLNRLKRIAKKTTQDSESTLYGYADAKKLYTNSVDVTPMGFGDSFGFTDDVSIEAFITDSDNQHEISGQVARSMEYQGMKVLAQQGLRHRIDKDSTYQYAGTATSGSTTTLVDTANLAEADNAWIGGQLCITNADGTNYDEARIITDSTQASTRVTFPAYNQAIDTTSKYRVCMGTGIIASDKMTTTGLLDVRHLHSLLETDVFDGNTLNAFIHADQERDLWSDTVWADTAKYDDSGRYANYDLVRWAGMNFHIGSEIYREDADGTENQSSGAVYFANIFGKKAYSFIRWGMGMGSFGVEWLYKDQPDSIDLRNKAKYISWKAKFAAKVMRSTSCINLMTGATDPGLLTM